jgi:hypothetical protein
MPCCCNLVQTLSPVRRDSKSIERRGIATQEGIMLPKATRVLLLVSAVAVLHVHPSDGRIAQVINPGGGSGGADDPGPQEPGGEPVNCLSDGALCKQL